MTKPKKPSVAMRIEDFFKDRFGKWYFAETIAKAIGSTVVSVEANFYSEPLRSLTSHKMAVHTRTPTTVRYKNVFTWGTEEQRNALVDGNATKEPANG